MSAAYGTAFARQNARRYGRLTNEIESVMPGVELAEAPSL